MMALQELIDAYVAELKANGSIKSEVVEKAFRKVQRHRLLERFYEWDANSGTYIAREIDHTNPDPELLKVIYSDVALVTRLKDGLPTSSTSQPALVAQMLEDLELKPGMKVLEIGAGTGYNAALMAEIVGDQHLITTIDIQEDVVEQTRRLLAQAGYGSINVIAQDGFFGYPENAPYDRIIATVGCTDISFYWAEQLTEDSFMLIPLYHGIGDPYLRIYKEGGKLVGKFVAWAGFMRIQGQLAMAWEEGPWPRRPPTPQEWSRPPSKELTKEYPPFPALKGLEQQARWLHPFSLFLAFCDQRAFCNQHGIGLRDEEKGFIVMAQEKILLYGDESLYRDLEKHYNKWEQLGRPSNYRVEFYPLANAPALEKAESVWVIDRKFSRQVIRLDF